MAEIDTDHERLSDIDDSQKRSGIPDEVPERFRLLIIGKSGCGKTTILSKVCGEEVADKPSTTRGTHDIEKEMSFKDNNLFVVHDSEGFEAGQEDEYEVVKNFIASRTREKDINKRLHAIWYCLATRDRPIQQAEELFFSEEHNVPVVAVFTKFDIFVDLQLQELMENEEEDIDEDREVELENKAVLVAQDKFNEHFRGALLGRPFPPKDVVHLSEVQRSTHSDPRLGPLIRATTKALRIDSKGKDAVAHARALRLSALFAAAQQADLLEKYQYSMRQGTPYILTEEDSRHESGIWRPDIIELWSETWKLNKTLLTEFATHVDQHPRTMGNEDCPRQREGKPLSNAEIEAYRCLQLAADMTVIMAQIFLLKIEDEKSMTDIVRRYTSTSASPYIQEHILKNIDVQTVRESESGGFKLFVHEIRVPCGHIIDGAIRSLMGL